MRSRLAADHRRLEAGARGQRAARRRGALDLRLRRSRRARTSSSSALGLAPRASSTTSPTSAVSSSSSSMMSARRPRGRPRRQAVRVLEHLDVGPQAGDRRAQLVAGVGDELALRLRPSARARRASALKLRRQAGELVVALDLEALVPIRSGCAGDRLGPAREARDRGQRGARDHDPEQRRPAGSRPRRSRSTTSAGCDSAWSTSVSGRATCSAPPLPIPVTSTRMCMPETVMSVDVVALAAAARCARSARSRGSSSPGRWARTSRRRG